MSVTTNPLSLTRVTRGSRWALLRKELDDRLKTLPGRAAGARKGGFTLRAREHQDSNDHNFPAALIYWGPLPSIEQVALRALVKPHFDLSIMRDPKKRSHALATADEPHGY